MVRIAAIQYDLKPIADFAEFKEQCRYYVRVASGFKANFILFPEMFTNQLMSLGQGEEPKEAVRLLNTHTKSILSLFQTLAKEAQATIIGGSHFTTDGNRTLNVSHVFFRDGRISKQAKLHATPGERATWDIEGGSEISVFEADGVSFGVQICYDVEFPEMTRALVERGARLVFVPFCTDDRAGFLRVRHCAQARCIENQIYVATAGVVGNLRGVRDMDVHYAKAAILTPCDFGFARDGVAAEAPLNTEFVLVQDLDMAALERARTAGTVLTWKDRRNDLYNVTWKS